jgi:UDP-N-acetylmuramoyl-tripeptide--D-alanyl-D-alanine ligase
MAVRAFTMDQVAALTSGRVLASAKLPIRGLCLDSRRVQPGMLFAALKGARADGHDFVEKAVIAGAGAVLVERPIAVPEGIGSIQVASVEKAIADLGRALREEFQGEVIAIVGSCGKTTTKDFAAKVLSLAGPVYATSGNRNNLLGLPETLMSADMKARFWVLELGISQPLEMEDLAPIARPTGVLFTTIQPVHTEFFPSLEAILEEKAKVLRWTAASGFAVINLQDPLLSALPIPAGLIRTTYGTAEGADIWIESGPQTSRGTTFTLRRGDEGGDGFLPVPGVHNLANFCGACAVGARFGLSLEVLAGAAADLQPSSHRGVTTALRKDVLLLDDSYNANPAAMALVFDALKGWGRRQVAALGEMLELGAEASRYHREVGRLAAASGVACLLAVGGENAAAMAEAFSESGRPCLYVNRWSEGAEWLRNHLEPGDGVLVKGSRAIGLDGLADWLIAEEGL